MGASRGASLAVIAFTSIVVARILGAAGIGTYAIAHALLFVFTVLSELGLPQALAYYAGRDEWSGAPLARGAIFASFALALPGGAAMIAGFALFGDSLPGIDWPIAIALTVALPFSLLWRIVPQAALAQERFEVFALLDSSPALLLCPTSIVGAAMGETDGALIGLAVATIASGAGIATWLSPARAAPRRPPARPAESGPSRLRSPCLGIRTADAGQPPHRPDPRRSLRRSGRRRRLLDRALDDQHRLGRLGGLCDLSAPPRGQASGPERA